MELHKKHIILAGTSLFLFASIAFASGSTFLSQAEKYIKNNCGKEKISNETAMLCYLFNKAQELDQSIAIINATLSPVPSQITDLQNHQSQDEQQLTTFNQQFQTLSTSISALPAPINWDITGTYTLRLFTIYDSPDSRIITITTVDPVTGQFSGTGDHNGTALTVTGVVNGSQFTLQTQTAGPNVDIQAQGSISPDGKFWGVGSRSADGHGFTMTTLSGAATKK